MVTQYGFSSRIGTVQLGGGDTEPFLGMTGAGQRSTDYSDATAAVVDQEVAQLLETAHQEAFDVLEANREILDELVRQLVVKETLSRQEVADIFRDLKRWPERGGFTGSDQRRPSDIPPVAMPELPNAGEPETHPAGGAQLPPGQLGSTPMPGDEQGPHEPWQPPQDWAPPAWPGGSHQ